MDLWRDEHMVLAQTQPGHQRKLVCSSTHSARGVVSFLRWVLTEVQAEFNGIPDRNELALTQPEMEALIKVDHGNAVARDHDWLRHLEARELVLKTVLRPVTVAYTITEKGHQAMHLWRALFPHNILAVAKDSE